MTRIGMFLRGIGVGAGFMYFFDPDRGKRRRALVRDQVSGVTHSLENFVDAASRDLNNRCEGLMADFESLFARDHASDRVIAERVRSKMGRYVSHPGAIDVEVHNGCAILRGPILANEVDDLLCAVSSVRGVKEVENRLEVHHDRERISSLQGGIERPGKRMELMQENWSPAIRLMASTVGGAMMLNCLARRTPGAVLMGTLGFGLFLRGTTNMQTGRLLGIGDRRGFDFQKTIHIAAPVDRVFSHVSDYKQFSRFMPHVAHVRELNDGRLRWTIKGPAGVEFDIDDMVSEVVPNQLVSWKTVPDALVGYEGTIRLEQESDETTRLEVKMTYNPPAGVAGHIVASVFGIDPKHEIEAALMRLKSYLETGKMPHDAADKAYAAEAATQSATA